MKIANLLLAVMFIMFAFVQINDPDPVVWILIYGSMAVMCILAAFRIYPRIILAILLVAFIGYSFLFFDGLMEWFAQDDKSVLFDDVMKMQYPYIEESREFLGLMICIIVLVIHLLLSRKVRPASAS
jgi:MFS superfamily sulfate permease-like transporter